MLFDSYAVKPEHPFFVLQRLGMRIVTPSVSTNYAPTVSRFFSGPDLSQKLEGGGTDGTSSVNRGGSFN